MERKELKFEVMLPADGSIWKRTAAFAVRESTDPRWPLQINEFHDMGGRVPESESSLSYMCSSWEQFEAEWRANMQKQAEGANNTIIYHQERERRLEEYKNGPVKARLDLAFDDAQITEWFDEAVQEKNGVVEGLFLFLEGHLDRDASIRKRLRPIITEAKQSAREEYPEEYREADDKEDFYVDHKDDIVQFLANSF